MDNHTNLMVLVLRQLGQLQTQATFNYVWMTLINVMLFLSTTVIVIAHSANGTVGDSWRHVTNTVREHAATHVSQSPCSTR